MASAASLLLFVLLAYVVYEAATSMASEFLQRVVVVCPLALVIAVHWLSSGSHFSIPISRFEPDAIHRVGGSPWGVALLLLLLFFLISYQPSLYYLF